MASDQEPDHSGRRTRRFDADTGWCNCRVCLHLPLYVGQYAPQSTTVTQLHDPDPHDSLGSCADDHVTDGTGWELGGDGG